MKGKCLTKLCSKFEVDITKMEAPLKVLLALYQEKTLNNTHWIFYAFSCHKFINFCHNIASISK